MKPSLIFLPSLTGSRKGSLPGVGGIGKRLVSGTQSGLHDLLGNLLHDLLGT